MGESVAVSGVAPGTTVVAGAPSPSYCNGGAIAGKAYVFVEPGGGWSAAQPLLPSVALAPSASAAGDLFGVSVAVSVAGDTIVAGAPAQTVGANTRQGAAYVFAKPSAGWTGTPFQAQLTAPDGVANDGFGFEVAMSGDAGTIVVGGTQVQGRPLEAYHAYVFSVPSGGWSGAISPPDTLNTHGGVDHVAISGGTIAVTAFSSTPDSAYVFQTGVAINITTPADRATYTQGQAVTAAYSCSAPAGATVTSCAGPVANGAAIDTGTLGAHTFTVNASDSTGTQVSQSSTYSVVLANTAPPVAPVMSLSASSLSFAAFVGQPSSQTLRITNTGNFALGISSSALRGSFGDFALSSDNCTARTVAAGASCTVLVTFTPFAAGDRSAQITFTDNASGSPHAVALSGTGVLAHLSGRVTYQGSGVSGRVQLCSADGSQCQATDTSGNGDFAFTVTPGGSYSLTAWSSAGYGTLSPILIPSSLPGVVTGLDIALAAPPTIPRGVTVVSPSFGAQTSSTAGPIVYYDEPNQIELARSLFPPNGTVVVTQVALHGA